MKRLWTPKVAEFVELVRSTTADLDLLLSGSPIEDAGPGKRILGAGIGIEVDELILTLREACDGFEQTYPLLQEAKERQVHVGPGGPGPDSGSGRS